MTRITSRAMWNHELPCGVCARVVRGQTAENWVRTAETDERTGLVMCDACAAEGIARGVWERVGPATLREVAR